MTREPGGTVAAEQIRSLVLAAPEGAELSDLSVALLMNAARVDHVEKVIAPALRQGEAVLCDRYFDSTRVYQSISGQVPPRTLDRLAGISVGQYVPDLTMILDAPPSAVLERRFSRGESADRFEQADLSFHEAVRKGFLEIAQAFPSRCCIINATLAEDDVEALALQAIEDRVGLLL